MAARHQPVAGDGSHPRPVLHLAERERHVDHREAGADDQHRAVLAGVVEGAAHPGVGDVDARALQLRRHRDRVARAERAERQDHPVGLDPLAVGEGQLKRRGGVAEVLDDRRHLAAVAAQAGVGRLALGAREDVADVGGVEAARQEGLLGDLFAAPGQPLVEVLGPAVDGAHPHRGHVQHVQRVLGAVGDPGAEAAGAVDQVDLQRAGFAVLAQQVGRGQGARGAAADDRDPLGGDGAHLSAPTANGTAVPSRPPEKASSSGG